MTAPAVVPPVVSAVERRLLDLYRLRVEVKVQVDVRLRTLDSLTRYRPGREVLRRELSERRALLRQIALAIETDEALLARYRLVTSGAPMPLGDLVAACSPIKEDD